MKSILVCIKQVPDTSEISMNPETGRINRTGVPGVMNPPDRHALQMALDIRAAVGARVTALCMGPRQAEEVLYEALAAGADRAILLCDPAFGGADTLATSRTLAAAVRKTGPADLVLCGNMAVDGDTGQVGPETAHHLGWNQVDNVVDLIDVHAGGLSVKCLADCGETLVTTAFPVLMAVTRGYATLRNPSLADWNRALRSAVEIRDCRYLGLMRDDVGLKGSPTRVRRIHPVLSLRKTEMLSADPAAAAASIARMLADSVEDQAEEPAGGDEIVPGKLLVPDSAELENSVWVLGETAEGRLTRASVELSGKAAELASKTNGKSFLILNSHIIPLPGLPLKGVVFLDNPRESGNPAGISADHVDIIRKYKPAIVLAPATLAGRAVLPRTAAALKTGLTADCTELAIDAETGLLLQTRPAVGGNILATIICSETRPQMATIRPHVFPIVPTNNVPRFYRLKPDRTGPEGSDTWHAKRLSAADPAGGKVSLVEKSVIVAGGKGIDGAGGFRILGRFAASIDAGLGASRAAVEAGWIGYGHQIGQTGVTVRPEIYMAVGISGAVQHLAGIHNAKTVIAVNSDPSAPVFEHSDFGYAGDWRPLIDALSKAVGVTGDSRE